MAAAVEVARDLSTWAYGIKQPGWYCARLGVNPEYTRHLESLGYRVVISQLPPED